VSLLPETVEAQVLALRRVDIHGQQYLDLTFRSPAGERTERIGVDLAPDALKPGDAVLLHRQMNMLMKVTRPPKGA